jgi:hypothetical protein
MVTGVADLSKSVEGSHPGGMPEMWSSLSAYGGVWHPSGCGNSFLAPEVFALLRPPATSGTPSGVKATGFQATAGSQKEFVAERRLNALG